MTRALQGPPKLSAIQAPVRPALDRVGDEIRRIVISDFDDIEEVNEHLLFMRGKLFRPTLLLLSAQAADTLSETKVTLAATLELIHVATLVHDDSVDHSVLRRGQPTVNAMFSHQIAVIMGDYLYSRAITELGKGEALVSFLEGNGTPSMVQRALIRPPSARVGPLTPDERRAIIAKSPVRGEYDTVEPHKPRRRSP